MLTQLEQYPVIGPVARLAREELSVSAADIQQWLTNSTQTILKNVASMSGGVVLSALGTLAGFFFMLFLLFFFLRDGRSMFDRLQRLIPVPEEHREQLFDHLSSVTRGVFYGIGLTAICPGRPGRHRFRDRGHAVAGGVRCARGHPRVAAGGRRGHRVDSRRCCTSRRSATGE